MHPIMERIVGKFNFLRKDVIVLRNVGTFSNSLFFSHRVLGVFLNFSKIFFYLIVIQVQEKKEHDFILQDMRNDTVKVYFLNPRFLLDKDMQVNTVKLFSLQKEKSSM